MGVLAPDARKTEIGYWTLAIGYYSAARSVALSSILSSVICHLSCFQPTNVGWKTQPQAVAPANWKDADDPDPPGSADPKSG
jgi:hypothetical protein